MRDTRDWLGECEWGFQLRKERFEWKKQLIFMEKILNEGATNT